MKLTVVTVALGVLALAMFGATGCKKDEGEGTGKTTAAASTGGKDGVPAIPPAPPAAPVAALSGADGGPPDGVGDPNKTGDWVARTVTPLLEKEAKERPTGTAKAEAVLAAVEKAGVKLQGRNQALGSIIGAAYCLGADTASMVGIMVCEYTDEAAAQKGSTLAKQIFGLAMPMTVLLKQKTSLSINILSPTAATTAEAKKITDAFSGL